MPPSNPSAALPSPQALAELMGAVAARQDRTAFAGLFRHFAPRVKAYLMRGGVPEALADDLAQDTLIAVWRKAGSYDPAKAAVSTWVFTIARNLRVDQLRQKRELALEDTAEDEDAPLPEVADEAPGPQALVLGAQLEAGVRQALQQLPDEQRHVLQLSFFEDRPHAAIAQALSIPLGTVKSRIRLAVARLRQCMDESGS